MTAIGLPYSASICFLTARDMLKGLIAEIARTRVGTNPLTWCEVSVWLQAHLDALPEEQAGVCPHRQAQRIAELETMSDEHTVEILAATPCSNCATRDKRIAALEAALAERDSCMSCDRGPLERMIMPHTITYGDTQITYDCPMRKCQACGAMFSCSESEDAQTTAIIKHLHAALAERTQERENWKAEHETTFAFYEDERHQLDGMRRERDALAAALDKVGRVLSRIFGDSEDCDPELAQVMNELGDPSAILAAHDAAERKAGAQDERERNAKTIRSHIAEAEGHGDDACWLEHVAAQVESGR